METCRFCAGPGVTEPLITPCMCPGTVSRTHRACLEKRILLNGLNRCYLCNYNYCYDQYTRSLCEWAAENRNDFLQMVCVIVQYICDMVVIVTASVYACDLILEQEQYLTAVAIGYVTLMAILFWVGYLIHEFWIAYRPVRLWLRNNTFVTVIVPEQHHHHHQDIPIDVDISDDAHMEDDDEVDE